jgi:D-alanine--poly(phosphoribitol) ligase subunit 2
MNLKQEIQNYITERCNSDVEKVDENINLFEAGFLDSMGLLLLLEYLEEKYQVKAFDDEFNTENFKSVKSIVGFVERKLKAK